MSIRTRIFGPGADDPLLSTKKPKGAKAEALDTSLIRRTECRRGNGRSSDRHRLTSEQVLLRHNGQEFAIELVNLSGGGAMIRGDLELQLWDEVELVLGEGGELDCAVRWITDVSAGLEFAQETRIDCDSGVRDKLLRAVIKKSFPDAADISLDYPKRRVDDDPAVDPESVKRRQSDRHPLIWHGLIYYDDQHGYEAEQVRLRNISVTGALVQSANPLPEGETVYLELRSAGRHAATVRWTQGDQSGLQFRDLFDIHSLSQARPEIASPGGADEFGDQMPRSHSWRRATIEQIARTLSG